MGGGLQDERGPVGGDDGLGGGRGGGRRPLLVLVSLYVLGQVVAPHEPLGALRAHKLLLTCEVKRRRQAESQWDAASRGGRPTGRGEFKRRTINCATEKP